jgi:hypothetical protein
MNGGFVAELEAKDTTDLREWLYVLEKSSKALVKVFNNALSSIVRCFEARKTAYVTQLQKARDISNMATRHVMQVSSLCTTIRRRGREGGKERVW